MQQLLLRKKKIGEFFASITNDTASQFTASTTNKKGARLLEIMYLFNR